VALLAGRTMLRAGVEHFTDRRIVDRGIPSANGRPSALDRRTFVGDPEQSRSRMTVKGAHLIAEYDNGHGLTLRTHTRALHYDKFYRNVFSSTKVIWPTRRDTVRFARPSLPAPSSVARPPTTCDSPATSATEPRRSRCR
jgi:hypothetical protein